MYITYSYQYIYIVLRYWDTCKSFKWRTLPSRSCDQRTKKYWGWFWSSLMETKTWSNRWRLQRKLWLQRKRESGFVHDAHTPIAPSIKRNCFFCQPVIGASKASSLDVEMGRATLSSQKNWTKQLRDLFASTSVFRCTIALRYHLFCFISVTTSGLDLKHLRAPKRSLLCPAMYMRLQVLRHLWETENDLGEREWHQMPYHPKHQNSPASQKKLRGGWGTCRAKRWVKRAASSKWKWPTLRPQKLRFKPRERREPWARGLEAIICSLWSQVKLIQAWCRCTCSTGCLHLVQ